MTIDKDKLEVQIDDALMRTPNVTVPADFAASVRSSLPPVALRAKHYSAGRRTAFISAGAVLLAVFLIAPHTAPSFHSLAFDVEFSLMIELACIAAWLATPRHDF